MSRTIRFHLDENIQDSIAEGLRRRGIDVSTTTDAGLVSAPDEMHLESARSSGRVIVTFDRDFLRHHSTGIPHSGIVFVPPARSKKIGEIITGIVLIWEALEPSDMLGAVEFL